MAENDWEVMKAQIERCCFDPMCIEKLEALAALARQRAESERQARLIEEFSELMIKAHPHSKLLREQLESGELERRLNVIGPDIFDPTGRVRLLLRARLTAPAPEPAEGPKCRYDCPNCGTEDFMGHRRGTHHPQPAEGRASGERDPEVPESPAVQKAMERFWKRYREVEAEKAVQGIHRADAHEHGAKYESQPTDNASGGSGEAIAERFAAAFYVRGDHKYSGVEIYQWLKAQPDPRERIKAVINFYAYHWFTDASDKMGDAVFAKLKADAALGKQEGE